MAKITKSFTEKNSNPFKISQILIPLGIGIIVIGWLFLSEYDPRTFKNVKFNFVSVGYILLAFIFMFGRDFGMIWRFRLMACKDLTWSQAFNINVLNEFTSAVTPSAVGGSSLVVLFLSKEGINVGRSTAIMISNLFLDELFFVIVCPIIFLLVPVKELFNVSSVITSTIGVLFWSVYVALIIWTFILYIGLFRRPDLIAKTVQLIFKLPFLRRWESKIVEFAENMINSSLEMSQKSFSFWAKAFGTTALSWSSRFLVVNALFMAFTPISNHLIIFGRQMLLWIVMVVSPTPGGSGLSEIAFKEYYNDIALGSGPILVITVIWRIISYYLYLLLGFLVIPAWITKSFSKQSNEITVNQETK
ncbi:MAG: flippase-like domain-containing protein [Paludibacter sp.]|nr:flippase-like domain-containing protein [Paludibacter sp.]